jgi:glycosyltransferase involved in cell wall biosynthesis
MGTDKKYFLGVLVTVKNEEDVIEEWIDHYVWQGVEHFYIIDNDSTDSTADIIKKRSDICSYHYMPEKYQQIQHYNVVFDSVCKSECEWLIICDADEYIYARNSTENIRSFLSTLSNDTDCVLLDWKLFGSNGHVSQPREIRKSFLLRWSGIHKDAKSIVRTCAISELVIHRHVFNRNLVHLSNPEELALNHYVVMSKEYFYKVKATRGDATTHINVRNEEYFNYHDFTDVYDDELASLLEQNG